MAADDARPEKRRRTTPPPAMAAIPDDLFTSEVLLRLPVDSLVRVKFVCRSWRAAVEDPAFVHRHLELSRARSPPSMLVIPREDYHMGTVAASEDISFHRLTLGKAPPGTADVELMLEKAWPEGITHTILPTHCDGLVAVATTTGAIFVCNPATREFVALPPGSRGVRDARAPAAALGYDPRRHRYVVARYFYREYDLRGDKNDGSQWLEYDIGHEVFTLGAGGGAGSWEATDDPPHLIMPASPICTREAFYWPCTASGLQPANALLRFGLRDRAFAVVPCPPGTHYFGADDHVTELAGKLCYVYAATETSFDVWLADDGPKPEWSLRCRIDFANVSDVDVPEALFPVAAAGDEILIAADHKTLYSYDVRLKVAEEVLDMEEVEYKRPDGTTYSGELGHHVVPYVESLVSIGKCNHKQ